MLRSIANIANSWKPDSHNSSSRRTSQRHNNKRGGDSRKRQPARCSRRCNFELYEDRLLLTFHLWKMDEVFSSADGKLQFIELHDPVDGESHTGGKTISSNENTFTFPADLPTDNTANMHFLIGTQSYAALPGAVKPDYTIPDNFFNPAGDTLNYADVDAFSFTAAQMPTDGVNALMRNFNTFALSTGPNSETNLAGQTGSITAPAPKTGYLQVNLVSDQANAALIQDPNLINPWGASLPAANGGLWVSNNGTGVSTIYSGDVAGSPFGKVPLTVTIPGGNPSGQVTNSTSDFSVSSTGASGPASFIFASESGDITGWNFSVPSAGSTQAQIAATTANAVYKGIALANTGNANELFATNFSAGRIDVFDASFHPVTLPTGAFTDPNLPAGYAPFNIVNIGGQLYVTYALQDSAKHDDVAGFGHGFVDIYNTSGTLLKRLITGHSGTPTDPMDSPWGVALAPANFGDFSSDLLVGNFGNGEINAFDPTTGAFLGTLSDASGKPVVIDGLWDLQFGNAATAGDANTLFFTAGTNGEQDGLLGKIVSAANTPLSGVGGQVTTTEATQFSGTVAAFASSNTSAQASAFTATIDWGDGTTTSGSVTSNGDGGFNVNGNHAYADEAATEAIHVTISDGSNTITLTGSAAVKDAPLTATGVPVSLQQGLTLTNVSVAAFTDPGAEQTFSTVPSNGDVNPYGVAIVPAGFPTSGVLQPGDTLFANFNNSGNTQGTGTTITRITPAGQISTFFTSTAQGLDSLVVLKSGFVIVANVPTAGNGTLAPGSLQVLDSNGHLVKTLTSATFLNEPWDMAVNDQGNTAQLFVSNVSGTTGPNGTVTRVDLTVPANGVPQVQNMVQIGSGYRTRLDAAAFVVGPGGLAFDSSSGTLYIASEAEKVSGAEVGTIFAIPNAGTTTADNGKGTIVYADAAHLHGPMGLALAPNGNLIVANADAVNTDPNQPSELVEFTTSGQFVGQFSIDSANGGAFGLAIGTRGGQYRLAAVDDNTATASLFNFQPTSPPAAKQTYSTVPSNGDVNPYGVAIVPAGFPTSGVLQPGDTLIANFNNSGNTQGTGTTITRITPSGQTSTFFTSTAQGLDSLVVLKSGFVIVANVPTAGNGTLAPGSLQVLDSSGHLVKTITSAAVLNEPWDLAVNDQGNTAQLFVSNVSGTTGPNGTVTRVDLTVPANGVPQVQDMVQIGSGYSTRLDANAFVVGPGGLAYDPTTGALYVASEAEKVNGAEVGTIFAIANAGATTADNGKGTVVYADPGHLHSPMGLALAPNGNLIVANADAVNTDPNQPSELVEFTTAGQFVGQFSIDAANGGAFGMAIGTIGGLYRLAAVDDNTATVSLFNFQPTSPSIGEYTATINWGDGTSATTGTVSASGKGFTVSGSHTYTSAAAHTITTSIADEGGSTATAISSTSSGYLELNLVSDQPGHALITDPNLVNPWGVAFSPTSPFWIADNGSNVASIYSGDVNGSAFGKAGLVVSIPGGNPTGQVANTTNDFVVGTDSASGPAKFIFASESGDIVGWNPAASANHGQIAASVPGAVFKGLAVANNGTANELFATNFAAATIDVFDASFHPVTLAAGAFTDPNLPTGFAPFGIDLLNGELYVSYAKQDSAKHDDVAGFGNGFIDIYKLDGTLDHRLVTGVPGDPTSPLNSPWGMTIAPADFGNFGGDLLVGNFGDGKINAFNPTTGEFLGTLSDTSGNPIVIDGLWSIVFGNGTAAGNTDTLFFTAGTDGEQHGTFGELVNAQNTPLTGEGAALASTEGATVATTLATFASSDATAQAANFTATIDWGDGTTSAGTIAANPQGGFNVLASHKYAEEATETIHVTVADNSGHSITVNASDNVADATLTATGATVSLAQGTTVSIAAVATFTDAGGADTAASYSATIDWGDGTSSVGTIVSSASGFNVVGSHTYSADGEHMITTDIKDEGGSTATATSNVTVGSEHQRLVEKIFEELLDRVADSGALSFFAGLLDSGTPAGTIVSMIEATTEYLSDEVQSLFVQYLHRSADPGGSAFFTQFLASGGTADQARATIVCSPEYFQRAGGSGTAFLSSIFQDALGRSVDSSALAFFGGLNLSDSTGRAEAAEAVFASGEFLTDLIEHDFETFLGRAVDPPALSAFLNALEAGTSENQIVAVIVGSAEFAADV